MLWFGFCKEIDTSGSSCSNVALRLQPTPEYMSTSSSDRATFQCTPRHLDIGMHSHLLPTWTLTIAMPIPIHPIAHALDAMAINIHHLRDALS